MSDTEQTYPKQRFEEGAYADGDYAQQSIFEFVDIRSDSFKAESTTESRLELSVAYKLGDSWSSEVIEQLRKRIRELETTVLLQNVELRKSESVQRNYDAALRKLYRRELETSLLTEDRDEYYNECQFYRLQAQEKTKRCENYEGRIYHLNSLIIEKDRQDAERKVGMDQGGPQAKRPRRHFQKLPTSLPKCRNCQTVFDVLQPNEIECRFHRSLPQPLKVWLSQLDMHDDVLGRVDLSYYKFWPCCEKYGVKEAPGCLVLKKHEIVQTDEE